MFELRYKIFMFDYINLAYNSTTPIDLMEECNQQGEVVSRTVAFGGTLWHGNWSVSH